MSDIKKKKQIVAEVLTNDDLQSTHDLYDDWIKEWKFLRAAYRGARALIAEGALLRHERESNTNFEKRSDEAIGFGYSKSIVELFNYYLFKEPVKRKLGGLENDDLWQMFIKDCDLRKRDFDTILTKLGRDSSIEGVVGVLVDKPSAEVKTREDEIANQIYPYMASYRPQNIMDFEYDRDEFNRPYLSFLKVYDDETKRYHIWYTDHWEIWELSENEEENVVDKKAEGTTATSAKNKGSMEAELIDSGVHVLGEIPFIWLYNMETENQGIGESDIDEVSRIDASIMKNLSQIDEVIDYAAFPMMRKPKAEKGQINDDVGVKAVLTFDPDTPEAKPDWLEARVQEPVSAIMMVIEKKVEEAYRSSNTGGQTSMEMNATQKSGVAVKAEFQLLNSKLVGKGTRLVEFELELIRLWTLWQALTLSDDLSVERAKDYDVENLSKDLENALTATMIIKSITFDQVLQKKLAREMLPAEPDEVMALIDQEIDEYEPFDQFEEDNFNDIAGEEPEEGEEDEGKKEE